MIQHVFPKSFQRIRYYGVQATKTFATLKGVIQEALAKVQSIVKGAIKIIAPTSRHYRRVRGRDLCALSARNGLWRIWHPTYGVIYDELAAMRRGKYASQATRAAPDGGERRALRAASGGVPVSLFGLVKRCSSMKPPLMWALVWPNSDGNIMRGLCPRWDAQDGMATRWNMSIKRHSPPAGRYVCPQWRQISMVQVLKNGTGGGLRYQLATPEAD